MATQNRRPLYAKIAIARKQLPGMADEETYRAFLESTYGKRSAADLTIPELTRLVQAFAALGARFTSGGRNRAVKPHSRPDWIEITDSMPHAQLKRKILAIWRRLGYSMASLGTRVEREFGTPVFVWVHDQTKLTRLLMDLEQRERAKLKKETASEQDGAKSDARKAGA